MNDTLNFDRFSPPQNHKKCNHHNHDSPNNHNKNASLPLYFIRSWKISKPRKEKRRTLFISIFILVYPRPILWSWNFFLSFLSVWKSHAKYDLFYFKYRRYCWAGFWNLKRERRSRFVDVFLCKKKFRKSKKKRFSRIENSNFKKNLFKKTNSIKILALFFFPPLIAFFPPLLYLFYPAIYL